MKLRNTKIRAFTLVEVVTVMGIIAVLTSLAIAAIVAAKRTGRNTNRINKAKAFQLILEQYYAKNRSYPFGGGWHAAYQCPNYPDWAVCSGATRNMITDGYLSTSSYDNYNVEGILYCTPDGKSYKLWVRLEPNPSQDWGGLGNPNPTCTGTMVPGSLDLSKNN